MRTRRVRALLARQGVPLLDETGWRLSTSAAAVRVRALLPAAAALAGLLPARAGGASAGTGDANGDATGDAVGTVVGRRAGTGVGTGVGTQVGARVDKELGLDAGEAGEGGADDWVGIGLDSSEADADGLDAAASPAGAAGDTVLEWLKAWPPARARPVALQSLEAAWRGRRRVRDRQAAAALWRQAQAWLRPWCAAPVRRPLRDWLDLLVSQLERDGTLAELAADAAGRQLLASLRLQPGVTGPAAWQRITAAMRFDLAGFTGWLESALDAATFDPPPDPGALVVLTPLARAIGRPFGAVVVPSSDQERLGAPAARPALIDDRLAAALGLEDRAGERRRQRLALAQLLRLPSVTFVRRRQQADEAVAESPELAVLRLHSLAAGAGDLPELAAPVLLRSVGLQPVPRPLPSAAGALPAVLSASAVGALRDCPYRFFSRSVLRLDEPAEFDAALAKRDYGDWLHLVLQHFHVGRAPGTPAIDDAVRLHRAAERATQELALDAAQLLPFRASFEAFVPAYLAWLAGREAAGWRFEQGEAAFELAAPQLGATRLAGRIDRIDRIDRNDGGASGTTGGDDDAGPVREVIDYKTGDAGKFRRLVANPLEDTQLAFYAALLGPGGRLQASYLALDGRGAPQRVVHERVRDSADALLTGLGGELARLRRGTPLPALGEGAVCETCEARGLCRRDHWASMQ
jgi:ATP-dependent helicase/nuclease subunit B